MDKSISLPSLHHFPKSSEKIPDFKNYATMGGSSACQQHAVFKKEVHRPATANPFDYLRSVLTSPVPIAFLPIQVDEIAEFLRLATSRLCEVWPVRCKDDSPRRVDDHSASTAVLAGRNRLFHITTLGTNARDEDRHVTDELTNGAKFIGVSRPDDESAVAVLVPMP